MRFATREFSRLLRSLRYKLLLAISVSSLYFVSSFALLATSAWLLTTASLQPAISTLHIAIAGVRFFGVLRPALRFAERYLSHDATLHLVGSLRTKLFTQLLSSESLPFDLKTRSDFSTRMLADAETVEHLPLKILFPLIATTLSTVPFLTWVWFITPDLAPITAFLFMMLGLISLLLARFYQARNGQVIPAARAQLSSCFLETLEHRFILAQTNSLLRYEQNVERLSTLYETELADAAARASSAKGIQACLPWVVVSVLLPTLFSVVESRAATPATAIAFILSVLAISESISAAFLGCLILPQAQESLNRLFKPDQMPLLQATEEVEPEPSSPPTGVNAQAMDVTYPGQKSPTLSSVTCSLHRSDLTLLAGPSGSGKSTLARVLRGELLPSAGAVTIFSIPVNTATREQIRQIVTCVSPESYLFELTLRENFLLAAPELSDMQIEDALSAVGLAELLRSLPDRLDSYLGTNGQAFSAGERQRMLIAQAFLRANKLLILDEALGHVAREARCQILNLCSQNFLCTVIIAHEMDILEEVTKVLYLENGRLLQEGEPGALLNENGPFARFYQCERDSFPGNG